MKYLLDTCVLSESRRTSINPGLRKWLSAIPNAALFISVLSIGEIRNGIERLTDSERKGQLVLWLEYELTSWFEDRILPLDFDTLNCWGELCAHYRTLPAIDSLLAATAIHRRLTLVTRNVKDFCDIEELQLLNPWDDN
ncbi:MAG: type II toxin-antitoxin system VapC family toxin [Synergistaceae bacterium]|jgi:predicted nucleic acid-binding protein|nr:type II toxin-antitoxin system VapC family toxin [Synergistaceae bacterium]